MQGEKIKILMVCLGNICRSPTAEGVFRAQAQQRALDHHFEIDSAGTGTWHIGETPDSRACKAAAGRNIDLSTQRARTIDPQDFHDFDYIFAMDANNLRDLQSMEPDNPRARTVLFLTWPDRADGRDGYLEVPDPFYSGPEGFELVLDLVESASQEILDHIEREHKLS